MKKLIILCTILLFAFSCKKKAVKEEIPAIEEPVKIDPVVVTDEEVYEETTKLIFTVQVAALRNTNENLANLPNVNLYEENSLTKYRLGAFDTYKEARAYRLQVIGTYKDAFVQALQNNSPISITEALQK